MNTRRSGRLRRPRKPIIGPRLRVKQQIFFEHCEPSSTTRIEVNNSVPINELISIIKECKDPQNKENPWESCVALAKKAFEAIMKYAGK